MSSVFQGKIVVTGGAGFIGSALIWALNRRGIDHIHVVDVLGHDEKWKNLAPLRFDDYQEAGDFLATLRKAPWHFADASAIFHLGACSSTTERDGAYLIHNNYETTKELARWALDQGKRFVYASSAATYGDGERGMEDGHDSIESLRPLNLYGYSKHLCDLYAKRRGWLDRIVGLKYFNVFGPNEYHKGDMRSMVHKAFEQIRDTGEVALFKSYHPDYPDGGQERDFLYVKDAVEMTLHLAETTSANGLFNLGSGRAHTWLDLIHPVFEAMEKKPSIRFIEMPEALRGKYQYHTQADISRLRDTGYPSEIRALDKAVRDYVGNYLLPSKYLGMEG